MKNNIICIFICMQMCMCAIINMNVSKAYAQDIQIQSKSSVLLEGRTGRILFQKDKDKKLNPASITKIMTLLLIFNELDDGRIKLTDKVTVSEHAASMGGSQVYLEPNEQQTVDTMIKCISIASANDAAVAMAEYIGGSEEAFVKKMNDMAQKLGMKNTHFVNCCGLDVEGHYSTAYDVALMSRELMMKHPHITKYTTVWMDKFVHTTRKGTSEFGLTNTNKLVRTYKGITGLKTGSTSLAKYCLSATANRNDINMIAVVMSAPKHKLRFTEAAKLLDYGFSKCKVYEDKIDEKKLKNIRVFGGIKDRIDGTVKQPFKYVLIDGNKMQINKKIILNKVNAPVVKHDKIGKVEYYMNNKKIGESSILSKENIKKATFADYFTILIKKYASGLLY